MNHETQRLLVAASRGARVQYRSHSNGVWSLAYNVNLLVADGWYRRIHPKDVHLQYGPVSTELRHRADESPDSSLTPDAWMADTWVHYCAGTGGISFGKSGNYLWLCAFAAELAADEGM